MKSSYKSRILCFLGAGSLFLGGCPIGGLVDVIVDDCLGGNTISEDAYDDLNAFQQLFWDENDCGRYESRSTFLTDVF